MLASAEEASLKLFRQLLHEQRWMIPEVELCEQLKPKSSREWTTLKAIMRTKEFPPTGKPATIQWWMNPRKPILSNGYMKTLNPETPCPDAVRPEAVIPEGLDPKPLGLLDIGIVNRKQLRKMSLDELGELGPGELASLGSGLGSDLGFDELHSLGTGLHLLELLDLPFGRLPTTNCEADKHWRAVLATGNIVKTSSRNGTCSLCHRDWMGLTEHHLQPRQYVATQDMTENERMAALSSTTFLCWPCHSVIHYNINNWDLGAHYNTPKKLKEHPRNAEWLAWAKKQTVESLSRLSNIRWYAPILLPLHPIVSFYPFSHALVNLK
ncbi:HNH endonuclease [Colletotrichum sojae]|uniref:HNH endonuclease n=1 Tax=Colletotrichum sojae TaxID=2175907 RepID=A0A8H6N3C6_9PEZI|nr:HNH endonuclease [Colletotrichum sojae]